MDLSVNLLLQLLNLCDSAIRCLQDDFSELDYPSRRDHLFLGHYRTTQSFAIHRSLDNYDEDKLPKVGSRRALPGPVGTRRQRPGGIMHR